MLRQNRLRRQKLRGNVKGGKETPRLSVFRSNKYVMAQAIDDTKGETLAMASEKDLKEKSEARADRAKQVGKSLAEKLKKLKIEKIIFDRGSFRYHGRIKSLAEGLREGGLKF